MKTCFWNAARDRIVRHGAQAVGVAALTAMSVSGLGCEVDSFFDQSVVGRWEYTPTVAPILERIDIIERDVAEYVETTPVMPEDLIPLVEDYRVGPGDALFLEIFDFLTAGVATPLERVVDARGDIDLPQLGRVPVLDLTADQIRERLREQLREDGIIEDALVSVQIIGRRQATYSVFGAIQGVGRYVIPEPNYRLLEALTEAGGISLATRHIFIIRPARLSDEARGAGMVPPTTTPPTRQDRLRDQPGVDLDDLIDDLTRDRRNSSMGALGDARPLRMRDAQDSQPPIDLIDDTRRPADRPAPPTEGSWIYVDGRWVRTGPGLPEGADPLADALGSDYVTQRVIRIPVRPLIEGSAEYNIVIRPGDIIRVPGPDQGFIYLAGPGMARPGVYGLPTFGRLTLTKAVMSAGGLSALAVPTRVDLVRMVGDNKQATIRLNLKAIAEGTHPDVFLKSDDMINVGTNFWAQPVAIIRNGFRASYGFGFLLDRNFGNDVFGAPPANRFGQ